MLHFGGLLLWLLQRPRLRFVPLPYGNVRTPQQWKEQAETMAFLRVGGAEQQFEDRMMKEAGYLRDRLGTKLSFLEDPLLSGMLAAKQTKGVHAAIQGQLMDKLRAEGGGASGSQGRVADTQGGPPSPIAALLHVQVSGTGHGGTDTYVATPVLPVPAREPRQDDSRLLARTAGPMASGPGFEPSSAELLVQVNQMMESSANHAGAGPAMTMVPQPANNPLTGDGPLSRDSHMGFQTAEQQLDLQDQEELRLLRCGSSSRPGSVK